MKRLQQKFGRQKVVNTFKKFDRKGKGKLRTVDLRFALFDLGADPYSTLVDKVIREADGFGNDRYV